MDLLRFRNLVFELAVKDFKNRFLGSYLGVLWSYIQPLIMILIMWFVFQVGFKSQPINNFPFILWLIAGLIPWYFFSDGLLGATNSILEHSYMVKKIVFRASILPIIKIISSLFVHIVFLVIIVVIFACYGYFPDLYFLQIFYYLFGMVVFILGLSWITASLIVFVKDVGQIVGIILQLGFWATPLFWSINIIPQKYIFIFKLNPIYYIKLTPKLK